MPLSLAEVQQECQARACNQNSTHTLAPGYMTAYTDQHTDHPFMERIMQSEPLTFRSLRTATIKLVTAISYLYCGFLAIWATLALLFGDRWWWLFWLNIGTPYLLVPLLAVLVFNIQARRRKLWVLIVILAMVGTWMHRDTLAPRTVISAPDAPRLRVMSFNVYGHNQTPEAVIATIISADPDVVGLQELTPEVAALIQRDLADEYPYQILAPKHSVTGMGMISRYPLQPTDQVLPGFWVGDPQVVMLDLQGTQVTLVNFHAIPLVARILPAGSFGEQFDANVRERERQASALVELAASRPGPFVVTGDLNANEYTQPYAILRTAFGDAWHTAGQGFGSTWPAHSDVIAIVRIDYVFYSSDWIAVSAEPITHATGSDHKPVLATLLLR